MTGRFVYATLNHPRTLEISIDHRSIAKLALDPRRLKPARVALVELFRAHRVTSVSCSSSLDFPQESGFSPRFSARRLLEAALTDAAVPEKPAPGAPGVKPCPLCGGQAYAGPVSAGAWGVTCDACHLVLSESLPLSWPRGLRRPSKNSMTNLECLARYLQKRAIARWNQRVSA